MPKRIAVLGDFDTSLGGEPTRAPPTLIAIACHTSTSARSLRGADRAGDGAADGAARQGLHEHQERKGERHRGERVVPEAPDVPHLGHHVGGSIFGMRIEGVARLLERAPVPIHVNASEAEGVGSQCFPGRGGRRAGPARVGRHAVPQ